MVLLQVRLCFVWSWFSYRHHWLSYERFHMCPPSSPLPVCRDVAHALDRTFLISLLQPAPEVINLFDDLLLLTDGRVIYQCVAGLVWGVMGEKWVGWG